MTTHLHNNKNSAILKSDDFQLHIGDDLLSDDCFFIELYSEKDSVLIHFDTKQLRIINGMIARFIPAKLRIHREEIPVKTKRVVKIRSSDLCAYCGDVNGPFEYDHLYPISKGGTDEPHNMVYACKPCNRSKGALTLREWMNK